MDLKQKQKQNLWVHHYLVYTELNARDKILWGRSRSAMNQKNRTDPAFEPISKLRASPIN